MNLAIRVCVVAITALLMLTAPAWSQQDAPNDPVASVPQAERFEKFEQMLNGAKLVGQFTILGQEGDLPKEEYTIKSVQKMPRGDYWLFQARIRYTDKDVTLPLPLEVKWAGDTPIITLTDLAIPVLGKFSSRVIIYKNKYAGTWTHGEAGGHLFGVIEKTDPDQDDQ